jgi:hypothetical protein
MKKKPHVKLVREGEFVAEVPVELIEDETGWSPYLSLPDARKLDTVRAALHRKDLATARKNARVYRLKEVTSG